MALDRRTGRADVAVVGAGIIGALTAWRLQTAGHRVLLLGERLVGGTTAGSAAVLRTLCDEPELAADGLSWYRRWSDQVPPALAAVLRCGVVVVTPPEAADAADRAGRAAAGRSGSRPRRCERAQVPGGYDPGAGVAWYEPDSGCADPRVVLLSLVRAFLRAGGALRLTRVRALSPIPDGWRLRTTDGPASDASVVLLAAGAATPALLPDPAARRRIHRQPVSLGLFPDPPGTPRSGSPHGALPAVVDLVHDVLLRPVRGGVLGTLRTEARGPAFLDALRAAAATRLDRALPRPRMVVESEFDLTGDGQPYVGPVGDGLLVAYGFGGRGFKLAPPLTEAIALAISTGRTPAPLRRFDPLRTRAASAGPLGVLA
ncbi:FAD-dependent oxidoreductase [Plantactinospora veratri]|uniref:FAD-dependent oxidoreductase n=1 Tax=Plantactinospora veratri TaxID=1436122 RepID=A0ABU7SQN2_9ACTN